MTDSNETIEVHTLCADGDLTYSADIDDETEKRLLIEMAEAHNAANGPEVNAAAEQLASVRAERDAFIKASTAREAALLEKQAKERDEFSKMELKTCDDLERAEKVCLQTIEKAGDNWRQKQSALRAFYTARAMGLDKPEGQTFSAIFGQDIISAGDAEKMRGGVYDPALSIRAALNGDLHGPDVQVTTEVADNGDIRTRIVRKPSPVVDRITKALERLAPSDQGDDIPDLTGD